LCSIIGLWAGRSFWLTPINDSHQGGVYWKYFVTFHDKAELSDALRRQTPLARRIASINDRHRRSPNSHRVRVPFH
jgi:hypothetical protein